jgi:hypothetical protein
MVGNGNHKLDQTNSENFGRLPNSHVMNVLISKGLTIDQLMAANEENMIEGAYDLPERTYNNE